MILLEPVLESSVLQIKFMKTLLLIDRTLPLELSDTLNQFASLIPGEVTRAYVDKANVKTPLAHIDIANNITHPFVRAGGTHIQVIGDIPMPYSGISTNPDGHTDTAGSYACPLYYVTPDGHWTDTRTNQPRPTRKNQMNIELDGKFNQQSTIEIGPIYASIGWLNLSRFNAKSVGSALTGIDWILHCYKTYFARNFAYRRGEWAPRTSLGQGSSTGREGDSFANYATDSSSYAFWGRDVNMATARAPYAITSDFKSLDAWQSRLGDPFAVLNLSYGSYQIDYLSPNLQTPLLTHSLASGSMGPNWNLRRAFQPGVTLGDLWRDTIVSSRSLIPSLYGDCTLSLS